MRRFLWFYIELLFGKRAANPLRVYNMIWKNDFGNIINHVRSSECIAMENADTDIPKIPCLLEKRKCCSIVTTSKTKRKYYKSSDEVVTFANI